MLQIISGKFFEKDDRHSFDAYGITYSNYSWVEQIDTTVATLEPVDFMASIPSYVIRYTNQLEKNEGDILVRTGDPIIIQQFQMLCSFALKAFFDKDRNNVEIFCRNKPSSYGDIHIPSLFVERFLDLSINGTEKETQCLKEFVRKVIGLSRDKYRVVMDCITTFIQALKTISENIDLAYSILIYCLESLTQAFDAFNPRWEDYPDILRKPLEECFSCISEVDANRIKRILIATKDFKLQSRFLDFIIGHIDDGFFTYEAEKINRALRKSELRRALRNAYDLRSKFVHELRPIQQQLRHSKIGAYSDVFVWMNEPFLTLSGLARLVHHVILNFVGKQEYLETEKIDWQSELPYRIQAQLAPQYWIWKVKNFKVEESASRLSGFLQNVEEAFRASAPITNIRDLLELFEKLMPNTKKEFRLAMFTIYLIFNLLIDPKTRMEKFESIYEDNKKLFEECSIEMMIAYLLLGTKWPWPVYKCRMRFEEYWKRKFSKDALNISHYIELSLIIEIANSYLRNYNIRKFETWLDNALLAHRKHSCPLLTQLLFL